MAETLIRCLFCEEPSRYSCPQCSIRYCSVTCYKHEKHLECSEDFYKRQVMKELKEMKGSKNEKQKVIDMLHRINKTEKDELKTDDISERLADVSLDDFDSMWDKLTQHEQQLFQKRIQSGNLDFIKIWRPWWSTDNKISKVVCDDKTKSKKHPHIMKDIPLLQDILHTKQPDCNLKYSVLEVLLAYVYVKRLFNGDMLDSPKEVAYLLLQLSKVLCDNTVYSDVETCLFCFVKRVETIPGLTIHPFSISFNDLIQILQSDDNFILKAMSDLYSFLKRSRKLIKDDTQLHPQLFRVIKKVYFLTVYSNEFKDKIKSLCENVIFVRQNILEDTRILKEQKKDIERNIERLKPKNKVLIEEL